MRLQNLASANEAFQTNHSLLRTVTCTNCFADEGSPTDLPRSNIALFIRQLPHESPGGCGAECHNLEQITPFGLTIWYRWEYCPGQGDAAQSQSASEGASGIKSGHRRPEIVWNQLSGAAFVYHLLHLPSTPYGVRVPASQHHCSPKPSRLQDGRPCSLSQVPHPHFELGKCSMCHVRWVCFPDY